MVVGGILILLLNDSPDPEEADGAKNAFLELFYSENDRFTKTGSGQTQETLRRQDVFVQATPYLRSRPRPQRRWVQPSRCRPRRCSRAAAVVVMCRWKRSSMEHFCLAAARLSLSGTWVLSRTTVYEWIDVY